MCQSAPQTTSPVTPPAPGACACGGHATTPSRVGRRVAAGHDYEFPEVPFPSARILAEAGEDALRRLVARHHRLLRESSIGGLFAADDETFRHLVARIADYVVETCGGPDAFSAAHGNTCMRTRHFPFSIDEAGREIWLEKLFQALDDTAFPVHLREEYWSWLEPMSLRMINRRTTKAAPVRLPYAQARVRFGGESAA